MTARQGIPAALLACQSRDIDSPEFATAWSVLALADEQRLANLIAYADWCTRENYGVEPSVMNEIRERLGLETGVKS